MNFVKFTENNDWEGENWNFWLQLDGNEDQLKELESWLGTMDEYGHIYELLMGTVLPEDKVDTLVDYSGSGYMDYNNKVVGKFTCPIPSTSEEEDGLEWLNDKFYKGGIKDHFK